jgi:hypothetical protein
MISQKTFAAIALSFPDTDQAPHFEFTSFRVNKKIFATLNIPQKRCTLKFNKEYQDIFVSIGKGKINAVPNAWGKLGWTNIDLKDIDKTILKDALLIAWRCTAPKKYEKGYAEWYVDEE